MVDAMGVSTPHLCSAKVKSTPYHDYGAWEKDTGATLQLTTIMSAPRTSNSVPDWIENPYPEIKESIVSFPDKHILLVTINREKYMNCLPTEATIELGLLWKWYDNEPEL
jgi:hypothetical protein